MQQLTGSPLYYCLSDNEERATGLVEVNYQTSCWADQLEVDWRDFIQYDETDGSALKVTLSVPYAVKTSLKES